MTRRNFSGHMEYAYLDLENPGVPLVCHLGGRLGVHHVVILGVHHDVHLGFHLVCRLRDLGAAN